VRTLDANGADDTTKRYRQSATAMASQAAIEGRFLGGPPPYGYQLADAGVHPNPGRDAIGQRLHVLEPDPTAAPAVRRIFTEYLAGRGLYTITEGLTADGIRSPSAHDPDRNRHRISSGGAWSKHAVRSILQKPRYTGRQVWNRQRRDEVLLDVDDVALGHETKIRWNKEDDWVWSQNPTHTAIVTVDEFDAARAVFTAGQRTAIRKERTRHPYALTGLMFCGICGRRMQGSWNNGRAYYRCEFPAEYAIAEDKHPKTVYRREDAIVPGLDAWIAQLFDEDHIDGTSASLAAASETEPEPDHRGDRDAILRDHFRECDAKLSKYRTLLEQQPDVTSVGSWIAEVERERQRIERLTGGRPTSRPLTQPEIKALVGQLRDIASILDDADPKDRRAVYDELGVTLTYHPDARTVRVGAGAPHVLRVCVGGASSTPSTRDPWEEWLRVA
jgi:site-specific DNA recombinase